MSDEALQKLVLDALDNAKENGYAMRALSDDELAADLCDCDADLGGFEPDQLVPFIKIWKERNE